MLAANHHLMLQGTCVCVCVCVCVSPLTRPKYTRRIASHSPVQMARIRRGVSDTRLCRYRYRVRMCVCRPIAFMHAAATQAKTQIHSQIHTQPQSIHAIAAGNRKRKKRQNARSARQNTHPISWKSFTPVSVRFSRALVDVFLGGAHVDVHSRFAPSELVLARLEDFKIRRVERVR